MNLVVGGYAQGKTAFACAQFQIAESEVVDGATATVADLINCRMVRNYHLFLRGAMERGESLEEMHQRVMSKNPEVILIADEIGCGLVPMEEIEREYRDQVGHLLCTVAKQADHVYRVFCGIGRVIK